MKYYYLYPLLCLGIKKGAKVRMNTKLHELGLDSVMASEMIELLDKEFKRDFSAEYLQHLSYGELIALKVSDTY